MGYVVYFGVLVTSSLFCPLSTLVKVLDIASFNVVSIVVCVFRYRIALFAMPGIDDERLLL